MPTAFVVHGAANRTEQEFKDRVGALERSLGAGWDLRPVWWGSAGVDLDAVRAGLPYVLPPKPGWLDAADAVDMIGPTVEQAETNGTLSADGPLPEGDFPGGERAAWDAKRLVLSNAANIAADVLMYWHRREEIAATVLGQLSTGSGGPANVIAHSLGAIITLDLILTGRLTVAGLVTFGTPVAAIHVLDPTRNPDVPVFRPSAGRIRLQGIGRWANVWNHYDPIGLVAGGVFEQDGGPPDDVEAELPPGTSIGEAHGAYFDTPELWRTIKEICS